MPRTRGLTALSRLHQATSAQGSDSIKKTSSSELNHCDIVYITWYLPDDHGEIESGCKFEKGNAGS